MKRIAAFLLSIAMLLTLLPAAALAENEPEGYDPLLEEDGIAPEDRHGLIEEEVSSGYRFYAAAGAKSYIRVLLSSAADPGDIVFSGNYALHDASGTALFILQSGVTYTLTREGGKAALKCGSTTLYSGASFTLREYANTQTNFFSLYNAHYSRNLSYTGDLYCYYASAGLSLVNRLYIEKYLNGVVGYEIGDGYSAAALQAQAIAARNYAYRSIKSSGRYDLLDTSASQVYRGLTSDTPNSKAAVSATSKSLLTYGGSPISVYYSASNGGWVEPSTYHWADTKVSPGVGTNAPLPYEEMKADPYDAAYISSHSGYRETVTIPKNAASATAQQQVYIAALKSNALMPVLLASDTSVSAANVSITGISMAQNDAVCALCYHHATAPKCTHFCSIDVTFTGNISGAPFTATATVRDTDLHVSPSGGKPAYGFFTDGKLSRYWLSEDAGSYTITHARYGHGVGMSQVGARQMASLGMSASQILTFYYPNTAVTVAADISDEPALPALPSVSYDYRALSSDAYLYARTSDTSLILGLVRAGDAVTVTGENATYAKISTPAGDRYLKKTALATGFSSVRIVNVQSSCNVRTAPSSTSSLAGSAAKDAVYTLKKAFYTPDWHQISYGGGTAYISVQYTQLQRTVPAALAAYTVSVALPSGYSGNTLWVDGVAYAGTLSGSTLSAQIYTPSAKTATVYRYEGDIPKGMYVYTLSRSGSRYTATAQPGLADLLSYVGFSIRVSGDTGLRFITGVNEAKRTQLQTSGINGWRLAEYGSVAIAPSRFGSYAFTADSSVTSLAKAYYSQNGALKSYYYNKSGGNVNYSVIMVGLSPTQYATDYYYRGYITLTKGGESVTLYGAPMARSIYYVAKRVLGNYSPTADAAIYNYLNGIITTVENG